jgi:hypothetical protein
MKTLEEFLVLAVKRISCLIEACYWDARCFAFVALSGFVGLGVVATVLTRNTFRLSEAPPACPAKG